MGRSDGGSARVAFIGLGRMGRGMAARLLDAGHELRIYNRTAGRGDELARCGAVRCGSPCEAASGATAILSMVADDAASREIWLGANGVLTGAPAPAALAIECSTLSHDWVMQLGAACAERGLRYIDAPVTGLPGTAAAGELTLLVGADAEHLRTAQALLAAFSTRVIRFGPVGCGTAYKLVVNLLGAVQIASAAEAMAIAERAGLDLRAVADALATGQAASPQVVRNVRRIADGETDREVVFTPRLRLKDVEYALRLARGLAIGSPFGSLAGEAFRRLCELGLGEANESRVIEVARSQPVSPVDH